MSSLSLPLTGAPSKIAEGDFPFLSPRFGMTANLGQLGEQKAFDESGDYRGVIAEKARVLSAGYSRHVRMHGFPDELAIAVARAMAERLAGEWPGMFRLQGGELFGPLSAVTLDRPAAFDGVCRMVMEDVVVLRRVEDRDFNAAIHLSFPNGWSPEEKIGRSFFETHVPVPGIGKLNARAAQWAELMVRSPSPVRRHVWGLRYDANLDHHPSSPSAAWSPASPKVFFRYERQTVLPMPKHEASTFLIRTHVMPVTVLPPQVRETIALAVQSMPPEIAAYKGIPAEREPLVKWIRGAG